MKPAPFAYHRPATVREALDSLALDAGAKALAGGQSLLALMNLRLARPSILVDLGALGELDRVFDDEDSVLIGALVAHRRLASDPTIGRRLPLVAEASRHIGHTGIRNRGTIGGSLAHADPSAELPLVMRVLGATVYAESSARGRREIAAGAFFESLYTTTLEPDELLTWVRVPAPPPGSGWGFAEIARRSGDFALAGACCTLRLDGDGRLTELRAGLMAVADTPLLLDGRAVLGQVAGPALTATLAHEWTAEHLADAQPYAQRLARTALARSLTAAIGRATGPGSNGRR
jgi:carbon-monoxide dehydrogenase medium subunit